MKKIVFHSSTLLAGGTAFAHDGHGLSGAHRHATDSRGLIVAAAVFAFTCWRGGRNN